MHHGRKQQLCGNGTCSTKICDNCHAKVPNSDTAYCSMCYISIINMQGGDSDGSDSASGGGGGGLGWLSLALLMIFSPLRRAIDKRV